MATRYKGSATSPAAVRARTIGWPFSPRRAFGLLKDAFDFEQRARGIEADWRYRLGRVRANSATDRLLHRIVGAPVLTVGGAAALIGRSFEQTNGAIERLTEAGILRQVTVGRRNRAFEAPQIIDAFTDLERKRASNRPIASHARLRAPPIPPPRRRHLLRRGHAGASRTGYRPEILRTNAVRGPRPWTPSLP